jgi:hypothetical protein
MSTITLESIKAEHAKVAEMIAIFEAKTKAEAAFPITVSFPDLNPGELWLGTLITGSTKHHVILLPGDSERASWQEQMDWAKSIGGDLPNRIEQAMLFAEMKDQFQEEAYWSNTQHASYSDYAWYQDFYDGYQINTSTSYELRARAVRRLIIQ